MVSAANLRAASCLEGGDYKKRLMETEEFKQKWQEGDKVYEDMTGAPEPIESKEEEEAPGWEAHDGVISQGAGRRSKNRAKEIAKTPRGMKTIKTIQKKKFDKEDRIRLDGVKGQKKYEPPKEVDKKEEERKEVVTKEEQAKAQQKLAEEMMKIVGQPQQEGYLDRLKQHLLDDVPVQFRKRGLDEQVGQMSEEQLTKRFRPTFFSYTMLSAVEGGKKKRANQWASKAEVKKLSALLDLPIASARFHFGARKRFQRPVKHHGVARLTVMLGQEEGTAMVTQEEAHEVKQRPGRKAPFLWRGMTLFLHQGNPDKQPGTNEVFVEMPDGLYQVLVSDKKEWEKLKKEEINRQAFYEAFLLQMKSNGKELDPRFFSAEERQGFKESDKKEWQSWIKNQVIKRLSPEEARKVDPKNIFRAPARIVRVNKGAMQGLFQPKSRIVLPGHLDPHLGEYRSDAPTALWVSVQMAKAVCSMKRWAALTFDVTTAFLSGKHVEREVLVRAPPDGLPAIPESNEPEVKPGELLRVVKSAYGLSEAPRLWYLRARELLLEAGFEELSMAKATFIKKSKKDQQVQAILCLHVDDGLLVVCRKVLEEVKKSIDDRFAIKEWKNLEQVSETFLGVKTRYENFILFY